MAAPANAAKVVEATEQYARDEMAGNDGSHDYAHVDRVRRSALSLAAEEGVTDPVTLHVVELAALLHDVNDAKYAGAGAAPPGIVVRELLERLGCDAGVVDRVVHVVPNVSYSKELSGAKPELTIELRCVQDADRLDAIGAIGVARTFCFGGSRCRALYVPEETTETVHEVSSEVYAGRNAKGAKDVGTVAHFYEKLLRLAGMCKTEAGRRRARRRHDFMLKFLDEFRGEWNCEF